MVQQLESIRDATVALSRDRTKPLTVQSVLEHYLAFKETLAPLTQSEIADREALIRDIALLFSLAFLTVGYMHLPISLYAKAFTLRSMLDLAVGELSITPKEDGSLLVTLDSLNVAQSIKDVSDIPEIDFVNELLTNDARKAHNILEFIREQYTSIPDIEQPLFVQITHMRRDTLAAAVSTDCNASEEKFGSLTQKLDKIKTHLEQGCGDTGATRDGLSETTSTQLKNAETFINWFKSGIPSSEVEEHMPTLAEEYVKLQKILEALNLLVLTRRWTLRCTDLYPYISELVSMQPKIFHALRDLVSDKASPIDFAVHSITKYEYIIKYMVRRAWVEVFKLLDSTEPVSEALSSIYNQLLTLKRCLVEVQNAGGISNMRELYPFQMKLTSLDAQRQDGKFVVDGEIPAGQGVVISLLTECFDMVYEMKIELDEKAEDEADESLLVDDGDEEFSDDLNDGNIEIDDVDDDDDDDGQGSLYTESIASSTRTQ